jgi:hypothetical protein
MENTNEIPTPLAILGVISFLVVLGKGIHDIVSYRREIKAINKKFENREKWEKEFCWQHYKGGLYRIVTKGFLESDKTWSVVYQSKDDGQNYIRPQKEWDEKFKFIQL